MTVFMHHTPNPRTKKLGFESHNFADKMGVTVSEFTASPFAALSAFISDIFVGENYLSVSLSSDNDWENVKPLLQEIATEKEQVIANWVLGLSNHTIDNAPPQIAAVLEKHIRPAVMHDGGDVSFVSFKDGILTLKMKGACSTCPSSLATLKLGILNVVRHFVPEVRDVVAGN
jgi:NFU1 iron-sulfur cluster scaffold homolog, mitochondrial